MCNFLEAFPVSRLFHEAGYPVFILQYRVNPYLKMNLQEVEPRQKEANLDFGRAMQYIFSHKKELGIRTEDYAVCGFSAGGRLCQMWGLDNEYGYRNFDIAKPAVSMLIYSGWDDAAFDGYYCTEPPTFFASVQDDAVIGKKLSDGIEKYGEKLKELGIPVERHIYSGSLHGFGTGAGTDAEGWTDEAILFWQKCMSR